MSAAVTILAEAVQLIAEVVSSVKERRQNEGIAAAADALTVIGAIGEAVAPIIAAVKSGDHGKVDAESVAEEMERLRRALQSNDAATDKMIAEKFDKGD